MRDFHNLTVWQRAHEFVLRVYRATEKFPTTERYGLTSQLRRSAASVPANVAEGCGRSSEGELSRFLDIASGSAAECEYHLLLAKDLGLLDSNAYQALDMEVNEIKKMLSGLKRKLRTPSHRAAIVPESIPTANG